MHSVHYLDLVRSFLGDPDGRVRGHRAAPGEDPRQQPLRHRPDATATGRCGLSCRRITTTTSVHGYEESYIKWEGTEGRRTRASSGLLLDYPRGGEDRLELVTDDRPAEGWRPVPFEGSWFPDAFIGSMGVVQRYLEGSIPSLPTSVSRTSSARWRWSRRRTRPPRVVASRLSTKHEGSERNNDGNRVVTELPLSGVTVLDFSQFLAGPVAALRLADLGARVIKIERPGSGDAGRQLAFAGRMIEGDSMSFHAMNRNKESIVADLKDPADLSRVRALVAAADVVVSNFRPGVMERLGLDYETVRRINPAHHLRQCQRVRRHGSVQGPARAGSARPVDRRPALAERFPRRSAGAGRSGRRRPSRQLPSRPGHHGAAGATVPHRSRRSGADQSAGSAARPRVRAADDAVERPVDRRTAEGQPLGARVPAGAVRHLSDQRRVPRDRHEPGPDDRPVARVARGRGDDRSAVVVGSAGGDRGAAVGTAQHPDTRANGWPFSTPRTCGARLFSPWTNSSRTTASGRSR